MNLQAIKLKIGLFLVVLTTIFTACEKDYYSPEEDTRSASEVFGKDFVVPESFDWSTIQSTNVTVKVDDQYDGEYYYLIEIYDANPLFSTDAKLLTKGVAKKGQDFVSTVIFPKTVQSLYIKQTDPTKNSIVGYLEITSDNLVYDFSPSTTSVTTKSIAETTSFGKTETYSLRAGETYTVPEGATVITGSGALDLNLSSGPYVFDNFNGSINIWNNGDIYVRGTVTLTNNLSYPQNSRLIVLDNANFSIPQLYIGGNTLFYNAGKSIINMLQGNGWAGNNGNLINKGELISSNIDVSGVSVLNNSGIITVSETLKTSNQGSAIENSGQIKTEKLQFDNAGMENSGTVNVTGHTQITNSNAYLKNNHYFTTGSMFASSSSKITNNCKLEVIGDLTLTDANIVVASEGLFKTNNMSVNNMRIELGTDAIFEVTNTATFIYNIGNNQIVSTGNGALLKMNNAVRSTDKNNNANYAGNLYIKCDSHFADKKDQYNIYYTQTTDVKWGDYHIDSSNCNAGGNPKNSPTPVPSNPTFPLIIEGNAMTYLFEDNWPNLGDYDLNDLVINLQPSYSAGANNLVSSLTLNVDLRAVGATLRIGAAIQLDEINSSSISSIQRSDNWLSVGSSIFDLAGSGVESGQTYAVVPLFNDAHLVLGSSNLVPINTDKSGESLSPKSATITINFSSPQNIDITKLNIFAINKVSSKSERNEIHLLNHPSTDKIRSSVSGYSYKSRESNLIWVLGIPSGNFKYPLELTNIINSYAKFENWATSGGINDKDWYLYPTSGKVY